MTDEDDGFDQLPQYWQTEVVGLRRENAACRIRNRELAEEIAALNGGTTST